MIVITGFGDSFTIQRVDRIEDHPTYPLLRMTVVGEVRRERGERFRGFVYRRPEVLGAEPLLVDIGESFGCLDSAAFWVEHLA